MGIMKRVLRKINRPLIETIDLLLRKNGRCYRQLSITMKYSLCQSLKLLLLNIKHCVCFYLRKLVTSEQLDSIPDTPP